MGLSPREGDSCYPIGTSGTCHASIASIDTALERKVSHTREEPFPIDSQDGHHAVPELPGMDMTTR